MSTYIYGIMRAPAVAPDAEGIGGQAPRVIAWDGLAAIVGDARGNTLARTRAPALLAHVRVLEAALTHGTVLPLRFGIVIDDDQRLVDEILRPNHQSIKELLTQLDDRVELAVRATYEEDAVIAELVTGDPVVIALRDRVAGVDPAAAYYDRIWLGERVAALLQERRARDAAELYRTLAEVSENVHVDASLDPESVVEGAFLVHRARVAEFDRRIDEVARTHPEMQFRYVGPLPPYSFCDFALAG